MQERLKQAITGQQKIYFGNIDRVFGFVRMA